MILLILTVCCIMSDGTSKFLSFIEDLLFGKYRNTGYLEFMTAIEAIFEWFLFCNIINK